MKRVHLHLIGFMGSGKTEVGRALGRRLNLPFLDADRAIEKKARMTVAEIFERKGEAAFRRLERDLAAKLGCAVPRVIAWGGGAWLAGENRRRLLASGTVVHLKCSRPELWKRLAPEVPVRPLLSKGDARKNFEALLKRRRNAYRGADLTVSTTRKDPDDIAREILRKITGK